ncbi:MAG: hypothetical protein JXR80_09930 [Deltaproteobacteria bacterium]|nr:hypothetical protein [Deltaproteobacteria bacterium]
MAKELPEDIRKDLDRACALHQRAVSDYAQCLEFSKIMAELLSRLEDADCYKAAGKVMGILLECNPKEGCHCEKAAMVSGRMEKIY